MKFLVENKEPFTHVWTMTSQRTGLFTYCGFQDATGKRADWLEITWQRRNETTSNAADKRESNLWGLITS